jgi:polysaccharide chain length determinant protein (PEP-CTERM system associated)
MLPGRNYTASDYATMAWRRRWLMVGGLVLGGYSALIVSSRLHDMYRSEMLIQVVPQRVPDSYVQSTVTMRTEERLNALSQQVLSRTALESLINEMNLYSEQRARLPLQDVVDLMRRDVEVDPVISQVRGGSDAEAFYVRFSYADREIATRVTERLGGLFIDLNAKDRGQLAEATNQFLASQLAETRRQLEEQERRLEQFREQHAGRLPSQLDSNMQAIQSTQLGIQALVESLARDRDRKLMLERLYNEAELEMSSVAPAPPPPSAAQATAEGVAAPALTPAQQLAAARDALGRLQLRLTDEHPDIIRTKRIIAELEARVAEEAVGKPASPEGGSAPLTLSPEVVTRRERLRQARAEIDSLARQIVFKEAEEKRLRETLALYQRRIEEIPGVESEWVALTRDYDTQQAAYKDLLAKSEQSRVAVELERRQIGEQFRILDPARPPARPTGVKRIQLNGIGTAAGLLLGVALAAFLEFRDRTFRTMQDVHEVLQLPIVAHVPNVLLESERRRQRRARLMASFAVLALAIAGGYGFWTLELWKYVV